jgi:hypothetical protein
MAVRLQNIGLVSNSHLEWNIESKSRNFIQDALKTVNLKSDFSLYLDREIIAKIKKYLQYVFAFKYII